MTISRSSNKYPAPALAKGLQVIETLQKHDGLILEELAALTSIPKASLLRMLDTLLMLAMVERDVETRKYHNTVRIVAVNDDGIQREQLIHNILEELSAATGQTAEWYVPTAEGVIIVDRAEPQDNPVRVAAKIGFIRYLQGELEAVARLAVAHRVDFISSLAGYWVYDKAGEQRQLRQHEVEKLLAEASENGSCMDDNYNSNGIRRIAATVKSNRGTLYGIMALAESFTPDAERLRQGRAAELHRCCRKLETGIAGIEQKSNAAFNNGI